MTQTIEPRALRNCLGRFATGVTVLTYEGPAGPRGVTVNAFSAISLNPPLILVSVARTSKSVEYLGSVPFCVNVLTSAQVETALHFAGARPGLAVGWVQGDVAPRLSASHAYLECTPWRTYDGGDHLLFLGEVQGMWFDDSEPLLFHSGSFHWRGDALDERGRSRRLAASPSVLLDPVHASAVAEFESGWSG